MVLRALVPHLWTLEVSPTFLYRCNSVPGSRINRAGGRQRGVEGYMQKGVGPALKHYIMEFSLGWICRMMIPTFARLQLFV